MAFLYYTQKYDTLVGVERMLKRTTAELGYPALLFVTEPALREFLSAFHTAFMPDPFDEDRDLSSDPHHRYPYVLSDSDLIAAGFSFEFSENDEVCRVRLEEPALDSALQLLALCRRFGEPVDISHYAVMHELLSKEIGFKAQDERLLRSVGFSTSWLSEHNDVLLDECEAMLFEEEKHPYDALYKVPVSNRISLMVGRGGTNALPNVRYNRCRVQLSSIEPSFDDLCSTATVVLPSGSLVEGYAPRSTAIDAANNAGTMEVVVAASEAHIFPADPSAEVELKLVRSGFCEVELTGVVKQAECVVNPWTNESFWTLLLLIHKGDYEDGNTDEHVQLLTPILNRFGSVVPKNGEICTASGLLSLTSFTP
jgi:hypothetical protein